MILFPKELILTDVLSIRTSPYESGEGITQPVKKYLLRKTSCSPTLFPHLGDGWVPRALSPGPFQIPSAVGVWNFHGAWQLREAASNECHPCPRTIGQALWVWSLELRTPLENLICSHFENLSSTTFPENRMVTCGRPRYHPQQNTQA